MAESQIVTPKVIPVIRTSTATTNGAALHQARVVFLIDYLWPSRLRVFQEVSKNVGQFMILCTSKVGKNRQWSFQPGDLNVIVQRSISLYTSWHHPLGFSDMNQIHFPIDTLAILARFSPDVLFSQQLGFRSLSCLIYRKLKPSSRLALLVQMTEHQQEGWRPFRRIVHRFLLERTDHVISNGPACTRYLVRMGCEPSRISEMNTACEIEAFRSVVREVDWTCCRRLLYVGRLVAGKGLLQILQVLEAALGALPGVSVEFRIVGYGPLEISLRSWSSSSGRLIVNVVGFVDTALHPEVYADADAFVFPTLSDEWGVVVNEAMASGLPVLGSNYSQAVEVLVKDGITGLSFTPGTDEALAVLKGFLSLSKADVVRMGVAAKEAVSRLTIEANAAHLLAIVHALSVGPSSKQ